MGKLWIAVLAGAAIAASGCGGSLPASKAIESPASPVTPAQSQPTPSPSPDPNMVKLVNSTGHFSFRHPAAWVFLNCDPSYPDVGLAIRADATHPVYCANEACYFTILVLSVSGDFTSDPPSRIGCMQHVAGQTKTTVSVGGNAGVRISDTFTADGQTGGFGPDPGTVQVLYAVYDGTRTYLALYQIEPNQPDETAAFDALMQQTFVFGQ